MSATIARREFAKSVVDEAIRWALGSAEDDWREEFLRLLWNVQGRSALLRPGRSVGRVVPGNLERIVQGLLALAVRSQNWVRPVETWVPGAENPLPLFSSLAHHLLTYYPVPPVLVKAWFGGTDWNSRSHQSWFLHVGQGGSLRTAGMWVDLTRRMAFELSRAPAHLEVEPALRWAQVKGLGGSDALALAVSSTFLGASFCNGEFWVSAFRFLVHQGSRLDPSQVGPIVDYLEDQKFRSGQVIAGDDTLVEVDPPQPELSLKGRTVASLWRQVAAWQRRAREEPKRRKLRWVASGVGGFRKDDEEHGTWTLVELLDADALVAEGEAMHHCAATYTRTCLKGESTLWSLCLEAPDGRQRQLTVELNRASRAIVQARRDYNEEPDPISLGILREWAPREGLTVSL